MRRSTAVLTTVVAVVLAAALVGGLALAGTLALGGGSSDPAPSTSASGGPEVQPLERARAATAPPEPDLAVFYDQEISWSACPGGDQSEEQDCASLRVPVDYAEPGGATVDLALLRVAATGQPIASLVVNPGGPGAPGTQFAAAARRIFGPALTSSFDVVGFDPRGTGRSEPVDCLSDTGLDHLLAADPDPDSAAEARVFQRAQERFFAGCTRRTGDLLGHVSTIEAARDMDVLRAVLGDERLAYFGASYGTELGATYAELFPDRVGRFVLDGAIDVSLSAREATLAQAGGFETALRSYVGNCVENVSGCYLGDSLQGGLDQVSGLLDQLDRQPLSTQDGRELTEGLGYLGIGAALYSRESWPVLDQGLRTAFAGDGSTLLLLADAYASRANGRYTSNLLEANLAINCLDDPTSIPASQVPAQLDDFEEAAPTFGRTFVWSLAACQGVRVTTSEEPLTIRGEGAAPILVVGTTRDPATPYEGAVALADQLDSGVLLTRDGDGHTGYHQGDACIDETVESYLVSGTVPEDGKRC